MTNDRQRWAVGVRRALFIVVGVILALGHGVEARAQGEPQDTVFLKTGGYLRGTITDDHPGQYLTILDRGFTYRVNYPNIVRVARVTSAKPPPAAGAPQSAAKPPVKPAKPAPKPAVRPGIAKPVPAEAAPSKPAAALPPPPKPDTVARTRAGISETEPTAQVRRASRLNLSGGTSIPLVSLHEAAEYGFSFKVSYVMPLARLPVYFRPSLSLHRLELRAPNATGHFTDILAGADLMFGLAPNRTPRPFLFGGGVIGRRYAGSAQFGLIGPALPYALAVVKNKTVKGYSAGVGLDWRPFFLEIGLTRLFITGGATSYVPVQFGFSF